jgi:hypothetical protein
LWIFPGAKLHPKAIHLCGCATSARLPRHDFDFFRR